MTPIPQHYLQGRASGSAEPNPATQYANAAAAIIVLAALLVWSVHIRKRNRKRNRTSNDDVRPAYQASVPLSHIESAYRPAGQVRAADTDADGRRLGVPDDPAWDGREALPIYNKAGSPPSYIESRMSSAGRSAAGCPIGQPPVGVPVCAAGNDTSGQTGGEVGEQLDTLALGDIRSPPPAYHPP